MHKPLLDMGTKLRYQRLGSPQHHRHPGAAHRLPLSNGPHAPLAQHVSGRLRSHDEQP